VLGDDRAADVVAMRAGEIPIEEDDVVVGERERFQRGITVEHDVGGDRGLPEACTDRFGQVGLVLGDQDAHEVPFDGADGWVDG
jgi:hypothetical protein